MLMFLYFRPQRSNITKNSSRCLESAEGFRRHSTLTEVLSLLKSQGTGSSLAILALHPVPQPHVEGTRPRLVKECEALCAIAT